MNPADLLVGHAYRDELGKPAALADHAHCPVLRVHEPDGCLDDVAQGDLDVEVRSDRDDRLEQRIDPVPGGQHCLQPDLQLSQQFVEAQAGQEGP